MSMLVYNNTVKHFITVCITHSIALTAQLQSPDAINPQTWERYVWNDGNQISHLGAVQSVDNMSA